jgi:hypothetical protein
VAIALAGALPLAALADRGEPWFDYRAFAEGLGPDDPVRFDWSQGYGPIDWPRDGNEVLRVKSSAPLYWKARDLEVFDGTAWTVRSDPTPTNRNGEQSWQADLPEDWRDRPAWTSTISVSIRRMRTANVLGPGTIVSVKDASRPVKPGVASGTWDSVGALRRGDSYTLQVHAPTPSRELARPTGAACAARRARRHDPAAAGTHAPGGASTSACARRRSSRSGITGAVRRVPGRPPGSTTSTR